MNKFKLDHTHPLSLLNRGENSFFITLDWDWVYLEELVAFLITDNYIYQFNSVIVPSFQSCHVPRDILFMIVLLEFFVYFMYAVCSFFVTKKYSA